MSKSNPGAKVVLQLTDSQVKILAEAAKMGVPEMIVRLVAISSVTKFGMFALGRLWPSKQQPEIHLTQYVNGTNVDPKTVADYTRDLIKKGVADVATGAAERVVKGETVDEPRQKSGPSGGLPDVGLQIPQQPEGNGGK